MGDAMAQTMVIHGQPGSMRLGTYRTTHHARTMLIDCGQGSEMQSGNLLLNLDGIAMERRGAFRSNSSPTSTKTETNHHTYNRMPGTASRYGRRILAVPPFECPACQARPQHVGSHVITSFNCWAGTRLRYIAGHADHNGGQPETISWD